MPDDESPPNVGLAALRRRLSPRNRSVRIVGTIVVTGLAAAYIVSKIDLGQTAHTLADASLGWLALSAFLTVITVPPQAYRWKLLLRARGIEDSLLWLTRAYFVSYAVGQVLPTGVGGDASRIFETTKRHPGEGSPIAGSVVLERAIGGAVTLVLVAVGFLLALGHYPVGPYLWIEAVFVVGTIFAGFIVFSARLRRHLRRSVPLLRRARIEPVVRAAYEGIHGYRHHTRTLLTVAGITTIAQLCRIAAIWAGGRAVGVELGLRPYVVLGPLLFLVMLVPFTINGAGVREAFFVSFLTRIGVSSDAAFATGFIFFLMTLLLALPGLVVLLWEGARRAPVPVADG